LNSVESLTLDEVRQIHDILVQDFADSGDPIFPPGVKHQNLLESAVARQHTEFGGVAKYTSPIDLAATLTFGLCSNHPFHNGNKRTALVAMLVHLDKNNLTLAGCPQDDLFKMIIALADHRIGEVAPRRVVKEAFKKRADFEVSALSAWIAERAKKPRRGERQITYRELRRILRGFGFELDVPASGRGNQRDVVRIESAKSVLPWRGPKEVRKRIGSIGYHDEGTFVLLNDMKKIRELCRLREDDGCDSDAFYGSAAIIDAFVNRYRNILRRLARR
jgi:death-on-curing family protein